MVKKGLFSPSKEAGQQPLAAARRPRQLTDFIGQHHIWGADKPLTRMVQADRFSGLIFWGPPGTGKTSLAHLISHSTQRPLGFMSAVNGNVKTLRQLLDDSQQDVAASLPAHLLFVDEIHRLAKNQQEVLLPALEAGDIRLIGATTENPSFSLQNAILSRSFVFAFKLHEPQDLHAIMAQAVATNFSHRQVVPEAYDQLAHSAAGDARKALSLLEYVMLATDGSSEPVDESAIKALAPNFPINYDRSGDQHYDTASALIKCIRASQPHAALHYAAKMLDGGEDPLFIARRLVISASEDIGNANPHALAFSAAAVANIQLVGMPEARIILGQIITFLATCPKSNAAYLAMDEALADVRKWGDRLEVPKSLRNAPTKLMRQHGYSKGYVYAHDDPEGAKKMSYLPPELQGQQYYRPTDNGFEATIKSKMSESTD